MPNWPTAQLFRIAMYFWLFRDTEGERQIYPTPYTRPHIRKSGPVPVYLKSQKLGIWALCGLKISNTLETNPFFKKSCVPSFSAFLGTTTFFLGTATQQAQPYRTTKSAYNEKIMKTAQNHTYLLRAQKDNSKKPAGHHPIYLWSRP